MEENLNERGGAFSFFFSWQCLRAYRRGKILHFFHRWKPLKRLIQRSVREELFKVSSQMLPRVERILLGKGRESCCCCRVANIVSAIGKVICFLLAGKPATFWINAEEIQEKSDTCWKLYNVTSISRIFSFVPQFESILFVNVENIFSCGHKSIQNTVWICFNSNEIIITKWKKMCKYWVMLVFWQFT